MKTIGQFLSPDRQKEIFPVETANRPIVGYAKDYPDGLMADAHSHPRAQVIYAVSGVMLLETQSASFFIPPTTALTMKADVVHTIKMLGPVAMRALFLRDDAASYLDDEIKIISVSPLLRELIVAACGEPLNWEIGGRGDQIVSLALGEIVRASPLELSLPTPTDPRLRKITDVLRNDPSDSKSQSQWAESAGASERTIARLFRKETGMTFAQWRLQAQMTLAMTALATGASPKQAASIVGFKSQPAFGAAFRRFFGITPGQARVVA